MPFVLTESSTLACGHKGAVTLVAGQSRLTIGGAKALVDGDLAAASIAGCITVPDPVTTTAPCLLVSVATGGVAAKLTVQGKGVLLDTISGQTSGKVGGTPQPWSVQSAGQTALNTE